jgi:hypothetical protein
VDTLVDAAILAALYAALVVAAGWFVYACVQLVIAPCS